MANDPLGPVPLRAVQCELVSGRTLYTRVIQDLVARAKVSLWIATANLKELLVEPLTPQLKQSAKFTGRAKKGRSTGNYVSVFEHFEQLALRGVSVRILHSGVPSTAFAHELISHKQLLRGKPLKSKKGAAPLDPESESEPPLALRRCPRVHLKTVITDGSKMYLGSANWTGAGLGAKGDGRRNFELGILTEDEGWLDETQALYERIWSGAECAKCKMRDRCPQPIDQL